MPRPSNRPTWRPHLTQLEDRTTPVTVSGNTVTLDDPSEVLYINTVPGSPGTYTLLSSTDGQQSFTPAAGPVAVVDSAVGTQVNFTFNSAAFANSFAVTLDNSPDAVRFAGRSEFGANDLTVTTTRNIIVFGLAEVTTTSGNITFSANTQATGTTTSFIGVDVQGSVTSGSGNVTVSARGGDVSSDGQTGVRVSGGATLGSTGSGAVSVTGTGGGIFPNFSGGLLGHDGVVVTGTGSSIVSGGGNVTVVGNFTATGGASQNYGVLVSAGGRIAGGGAGAVSVTGGGTYSAGALTANEQDRGVLLTGLGSAVTSAGGPVSLTAEYAAKTYMSLAEGVTVASGGNAPVTVVTNTLNVAPTAAISAGTGTVTIRPFGPLTVGLNLNDYASNYPSGVNALIPRVLGLTDAELDRVFAGTLVLGDGTSRLVLSDAITRPTATAVQLVGSRMDLAGAPAFDTGGGPLTLTVGGTINHAYTNFSPTNLTNPDLVFTASSVSFSPGTRLIIPPNFAPVSPMPSTAVKPVARLRVNGALDLTNLTGQVGGDSAIGQLPTPPQAGDVFTVATATTLTGTFVGRPAGSTVTVDGVQMVVNYTGTTATLSVGGPTTPPPTTSLARVVTAVGDTVRVLNPADGSTRTLVPFSGFSVSVASADLNGDGVPEVVVGAGPGGGPHVRVFDGATGAEAASFFAFDVAFGGGVNVAATAGRVVVGAGPGGGPHVKVIDATRLTQTQANGVIANSALVGSFFAFDVAFAGGVSVAVGDLTADGTADLVVGAGAGGGPHVKVIDGTRLGQVQASGVIADAALLANFFAFDIGSRGGVSVGATNGRFAVGAGAGGEPQFKLYRIQGGLVEERNDRAFDAAFRGGVRVGFADADADGDVDLLTAAGPGGGPHLKAFNVSPFALVRSEFVADPTDTRGVVV